ncbi:ABC transporter substrate-binding protein, partial [Acidisphaera rubrifaciens]|uniref:ABC transporter substrate-binding protein n=1 Tax=Acidisphaera rubrifaciens TaxID=50715 RepID=UPI00066229C8
ITANYVFGQQLQRDTTRFVEAAHGKVLGSAMYPFPETSDFSSFLVQAQSSGAKVVGFCNAGADTVNSVKQAHEFGLAASGVKLAAMLASLNVIDSLGLEAAQGLLLTESFYWDMNDRTRAFTKRLLPTSDGKPANMVQAGVYSGAIHYLKAVQAVGPAVAKQNGAAVIAQMKKMPTDDDAYGRC